jgi:hypothetical protein
MKRLNLRSVGKLKCNAWSVSAIVSPTTRDGQEVSSNDIEREERRLIGLLPRAEAYIINEILIHPGLENTKFNIVKTMVMDQSTSYFQDQLAFLGYFATNYVN